MKIIRNGTEIELTRQELKDAYYECEHLFDVEYITGCLLDYYVDNNSSLRDIEMKNRLRNGSEFADRVAYRYRKFLMDKLTPDDEWGNLVYAYDYILMS